MVQDVCRSAACVFEGIGEDRYTVEDTFVVDGLGKVGDAGS